MKKICLGMINVNLRPVASSGEGEKGIREVYTRTLIVSIPFYFCENKDLKQICQKFQVLYNFIVSCITEIKTKVNKIHFPSYSQFYSYIKLWLSLDPMLLAHHKLWYYGTNLHWRKLKKQASWFWYLASWRGTIMDITYYLLQHLCTKLGNSHLEGPVPGEAFSFYIDTVNLVTDHGYFLLLVAKRHLTKSMDYH